MIQEAKIEDYTLYQSVARDVRGNIIFSWATVGVVWVVNALWLMGAKALFGSVSQ